MPGWNPISHRRFDNGGTSMAARGPSSVLGSRDADGRTIAYHDDPVRNPAAAFVPQGYLRRGYDSDRTK